MTLAALRTSYPIRGAVANLLAAVPVGPQRAQTARQIWQRFDLGAENTVSTTLALMVREGLIERRADPTPTGFRWLYWRTEG